MSRYQHYHHNHQASLTRLHYKSRNTSAEEFPSGLWQAVDEANASAQAEVETPQSRWKRGH